MQILKMAMVILVIVSFAVLAISNTHLKNLADGVKADKILVRKKDNILELYSDGILLKSYPVSFGANPSGHKIQEGDERTPEGLYEIDRKNPESGFYLSLHVSYPDSNDIQIAQQSGVNPGGLIMIHGMRNRFGWIGKLHRFINWTDGCIAVTNREMDEIWRAVDNGTQIEITP